MFELVLLASFATTMFQGALQWEPSQEVNGSTVAALKIAVGPIVGLLVGFAVSRLRSMIAGVLFLLSVGLALVLTGTHLAAGDSLDAAFSWGLLTIVLDVICAAIILIWVFRPTRMNSEASA